MDGYNELLAQIKKCRILKTVDLISKYDYPELVRDVQKAVKENIIVPVKASKLNGMRPPLYREYRRVTKKKDYTDVLKEICSLPLGVATHYYTSHIEEYLKHKDSINKLLDFLSGSAGREMLSIACSINERSFQIFADEKHLRHVERNIIKNLGIEWHVLNCYDTPEPFFYLPFNRLNRAEDRRHALIVENKDTFHTLRLISKGELLKLNNIDFDILIYGEGKKILSSFPFIKEIGSFMPNNTDIYYFGDIDYAGISFYIKLQKNNSSWIIKPFVELYEAVLDIGKDTKAKCKTEQLKDSAVTDDISVFLLFFNKYYSQLVSGILNRGFYVPQEALSMYHLLKLELVGGRKVGRA